MVMLEIICVYERNTKDKWPVKYAYPVYILPTMIILIVTREQTTSDVSIWTDELLGITSELTDEKHLGSFNQVWLSQMHAIQGHVVYHN